MFRSTRRRKAASSRNAQVSGAASSLPGPVSSFEECRLQFEVLSSYLECPLGVSEHEVAQAGESRMERARKMEKVSDECLLDRVVDLAEEVRYRQITPWALGSNDKRVWPGESKPGHQAARVNLACLSPKGLLVVVIDAHTTLTQRFPMLASDSLASDARAAQELEERDAQLARALSEQDADTERRVSRMSDLLQLLPANVTDTLPVTPTAAESMEADARAALRLHARLSAQHHHAVSASIMATASSVRSRPASDPGRQTKADDSGMCVVCIEARADTLLLDCRHLSMCHECTRGVLSISPSRCPVCRMAIRNKKTSVIRVFLT